MSKTDLSERIRLARIKWRDALGESNRHQELMRVEIEAAKKCIIDKHRKKSSQVALDAHDTFAVLQKLENENISHPWEGKAVIRWGKPRNKSPNAELPTERGVVEVRRSYTRLPLNAGYVPHIGEPFIRKINADGKKGIAIYSDYFSASRIGKYSPNPSPRRWKIDLLSS